LTRSGRAGKESAVTNEIQITLTALADPGRRKTLELLAERPMRAVELAVIAGTSRPSAGRHLRDLIERGLVEPAEGGRQGPVYRVRPERFVALNAWLTDLSAHWRGQLDSSRVGTAAGSGRTV
jgi:DNA-binding transcriptional ArsR family regulator